MTNREYFSSYLTGLFESIGTISIKKNNRFPHIYFSFHKDNKLFAEEIQKIIGFGKIYEKKTVYSYEIFNKDGIIKFIELTQKYFRTPKIYEFNNMLEYLNTKKNYNFNFSEIDLSSFETNAWLSGYLESSGSFTI